MSTAYIVLNRVLTVATAAVLLRVLIPLSALAQGAPATANNELLRINFYPGSVISVPIWILTDKGFCVKHKLRCEAIPIPSAPVSLQALAAGSTEIHMSSTDVTMQSAARGNDVQIIAGFAPNNVFALNVRSDVPLPHRKDGYPAIMGDLKGLTVGVTARGAATEIQTRALLVGAGMAPDSVTYFAAGSPPTAYPMLVEKQLDAAMMYEPFDTLCNLQKTCITAVNLPSGEGPAELKALNGAFVTLVATRKYVSANPIAIKAFLQAMGEAIAWTKNPQNFPEVLKVSEKYLSLSNMPNAEALREEVVRKQIPNLGIHVERSSVNAFSDFLLKYKMIPKPVAAESFVYREAP